MKLTDLRRKDKWGRLARRHARIRKRVSGTAERPRLLVRKTNKHVYASVLDDSTMGGVRNVGSKTLLAVSTEDLAAAGDKKNHRNVAAAKSLGQAVAAKLKEKNVTAVVFDRGGYAYHGVVKALCDAVREAGIQV